MGRITIFTAANDLNSKQVQKELEKRNLPFTEIDVSTYPSKLVDLEALVGSSSVPHVFFNTRYIGGVDSLKKELDLWDQNTRYGSPLEKYKGEIASNVDPRNPRLAIPDKIEKKVAQEPARARKAKALIQMPDGTKILIRDLTEKLKQWVPVEDCKYNNTVFKYSFTGRTLTSALQHYCHIDSEEAQAFAQTLINDDLIRHVDTKSFPVGQKSKFQHTTEDVYQLRCDAEPDVLNSYLTWPISLSESVPNCTDMVINLGRLMSIMEMSSIDPRDGLLNAVHAVTLKKFPMFEEAICELQAISMSDLFILNEEELTAFALNLYNVLIRYAYLKKGVPTCDADRLHLLSRTKFIMAGEIYTLQDWTDILLSRSAFMGGQSSSANLSNSQIHHGSQTFSQSYSANSEDTYAEHLAIKQDKRIHFALFVGPHGGSRWSPSFLHYTAENLDKELDIVSHVFCHEDRNIEVDRKEGKIVFLSSVFKAHRSDFGSKDSEIPKAILPYMCSKKQSDVSAMVSGGKPIKISFSEPELGLHTVCGPWYRKGAGNSKSSSKPRFMGSMIKGLKAAKRERNNSMGSVSSTISRSDQSYHSCRSDHSFRSDHSYSESF